MGPLLKIMRANTSTVNKTIKTAVTRWASQSRTP
jgi:hypothetical protein